MWHSSPEQSERREKKSIESTQIPWYNLFKSAVEFYPLFIYLLWKGLGHAFRIVNSDYINEFKWMSWNTHSRPVTSFIIGIFLCRSPFFHSLCSKCGLQLVSNRDSFQFHSFAHFYLFTLILISDDKGKKMCPSMRHCMDILPLVLKCNSILSQAWRQTCHPNSMQMNIRS